MPGKFQYAQMVLFGLVAFAAPGPAKAEVLSAFDSVAPATGKTQNDTDAATIYQLVINMIQAWNNKDIDGFLSFYWQSPQLLAITDSDIIRGWSDLKATLTRGYHDRNEMGIFLPDRIQVTVTAPDLAIVLHWWTMRFPKSQIFGNSSLTLQKFPEGWKVIMAHTGTAESPN